MLARLTKAIREKDKGFTLIELLVVIIIIGILAAIAIPIFLNQRKKGIDSSIKSDIKQFATQVETYYTDTQTYPAESGAGAAVQTGGAGSDISFGGETVTVSEGNILTYQLTGDRYVICGANTKGTATAIASAAFVYDSSAGGLSTAALGACPTI